MSEQQFRPAGFRLLPPVVKNLLIINGMVFIMQIVLESSFGIDLADIFGLHYFAAQKFGPWQFITYMFLHGSMGHVFFNMFALWMFGYALENIWGPKRFLTYYLITGIGAGLVHYFVIFLDVNPVVTAINNFISDPSTASLQDFARSHQFRISEYSGSIYQQFIEFERSYTVLLNNPGDRHALQSSVNFMVDYREYILNLHNVIGASGAVFGILLAFGMLFPNSIIYLYFFIRMKAKYFVIMYGIAELVFGITGQGGNIAHFAHLGGMFFGFIMIRYWKKKGNLY